MKVQSAAVLLMAGATLSQVKAV